MNLKRLRKLNNLEFRIASDKQTPIVYWMNRDQRTDDNWALLYAQHQAIEYKQPLLVVFNLVADYLGGGLRQLVFKIKALQELEKNLQQKNIPFFVLFNPVGSPSKNSAQQLIDFLQQHQAGLLVTDFSPLKISNEWLEQLMRKLKIPIHQVDAHNIVPCWIASPKQEFAAYTFRPKIHRLLPEFLEDFPELKKQPIKYTFKANNDWHHNVKKAHNSLTQRVVPPVDWLESGEKAALKQLNNFLNQILPNYGTKRNDPTAHSLSDLSPYLHYGQIAPQRVVLEVERCNTSLASQEAFLEEIIVRRELSDNFCFYNNHYDSFEGFPSWAKTSLHQHREDPREHLYSLEEFEKALTHDPLWNAAQMEMVKRGKMHGYMRMYWAKKILEWTVTPEEALKIAIYLNDRYELDGRDPNGYVGIAWSIGGVHDRAWFERPIFGKIRYMSYNGCKSKFDVQKYIDWVEGLEK